MHERRIFSELLEHLPKRPITVITGMRRVGKSTALRYLLDRVPHENKIYLDLERVEHRYKFQFANYRETQIELEIEGIDFSQPAVIALDEIQLVPEITSVVKYFHDHFPVKFLVTGSSSFYLKNHFSESLAGRKQVFEMYPLDFQEFLRFREMDGALLEKFRFQPFQPGIYDRFREQYEQFVKFGGFPEVALASSEKDKIAHLRDIVNSYIELDIKLLSDFAASADLYKLIRLLAVRAGSLFDFAKISAILGINRNKLTGYISLLEQTYFLYPLPPFSNSIDRELSLRKKIFFADTGILNLSGQVSSGALFENAIAAQLKPLGELHYYQRRSGQEIDFILNRETAIEVKETPTQPDLAVLFQRAKSVGLEKTMLIGRYPPGSPKPAGAFRDFIWGGTVF